MSSVLEIKKGGVFCPFGQKTPFCYNFDPCISRCKAAAWNRTPDPGMSPTRKPNVSLAFCRCI